MRRADREITDPSRIREIIDSCVCCRLGFNDDGKVYIVPLNFGYEVADGRYTFYFHGADEGRKLDLIRREKYAGFELDTGFGLIGAEVACAHSATYRSVIGTGKMSIIDGAKAKVNALQKIMLHNTGKGDWQFTEAMLERVAVFKLEAEELSCKERK